jgi:hypothetical protein
VPSLLTGSEDFRRLLNAVPSAGTCAGKRKGNKIMTNNSKPMKDFWAWADLLVKFMPVIVVAIIAFMGNQFLQNKQKTDSNLKLYTQLLANKEDSENTLRKDMFEKMIASFLSQATDETEDFNEKTRMMIGRDLLSLDLLARNFHESLDMKPLFKHVLMKIVRPRVKIKRKYGKNERLLVLSKSIDFIATSSQDKYTKDVVDDVSEKIDRILVRFNKKEFLSEQEQKWMQALEFIKQELQHPGAMSTRKKHETLKSILVLNLSTLKEKLEAARQNQKQDKALDQKYDSWLEKTVQLETNLAAVNAASLETIAIVNKRLLSLIIDLQKHIKRNLFQYDRELDRLIAIAKRISTKQREVLEDVAGKLSLTIPLNGYEAKKVCTKVDPNDVLQIKMGICHCTEEIEKENGDTVTGVTVQKELSYRDANNIPDERSKRHFEMTVRYAYPQWKQVYVEIATGPDQNRHDTWKRIYDWRQRIEKELINREKNQNSMDAIYKELTEKYQIKLDKEQFAKMTIGEFNAFLKTQFEIETSAFWLEYFDFPLVDNSYINNEQRYSVILEGFKLGRNGEDESAKITLLYYPASYAGLKEKSFYNNKLMNYLMNQDFFNNSNRIEDKRGI